MNKTHNNNHRQPNVLAQLILDPHQPVTYWRPADGSQPAQAFVEVKLVDGRLPSDEDIQKQIAAALEDQTETASFSVSVQFARRSTADSQWQVFALALALLIISVSLNILWRML